MKSPICLVEIELDSGVRRYSFAGDAIPGEGWFQDKLVTVGEVTRESPIQASAPRLGDSSLEIFDPELRALKATEAFRNRVVRYRFGDATDGPEGITTLYTGRITRSDFNEGLFQGGIRDSSFDRFDQALAWRLNRVDFPELPADFQAVVIPTIYGEVTSAADSATGAVPCFRIAEKTYLVARHVCKSILNVYNYGMLMTPVTDWTEGTVTVDGVTMQTIVFVVDPRDITRPNEFEITADVQGKTDDGTTSGNLIELPAEQLQDYLTDVVGVDSSEFSTDHFEAATALQVTEEYVGSAWISDESTYLDVIARFSESFVMPFFLTREGLYAIAQLTANGIFGLDGDFDEITDANDVFRDSFHVLSNESVASLLEYSYRRDWAAQNWQRVTDQENTPELVNLGNEIRVAQDLPYVQDVATADRVAAVRLLVSAENQQFVSFELPEEYHRKDLNEFLLLTHHLGLGADGYARVPFRIVTLTVMLQPSGAKIEVLAARNVDDLAHCDNHADAHGDTEHADAVHTDVAHSDVAHSDVAHSDVSHSDSHSDSAHTDTAHSDAHGDDNAHHDQPHEDGHADSPHTDSHTDSSETAHGDHNDGGHTDHSDVISHTDSHSDVAHDDEVGNSPHQDSTHSDSHSDVSHSDAGHADAHGDVAHSDSHTDSHGDTAHSDGAHQDEAHSDTEHDDYHCDTDLDHTDIAHEDTHDDVAHSDVAHSDVAHSDAGHADAAHSDSHSDGAHSDTAHTDSHTDTHSDANPPGHDDHHTDHADSGDFDPPFDNTHEDEHGDSVHSDSHSDSHSDVAHSDTAHSDTHSDVAHSDTAHSDTAHSDVAHSDTAHDDDHSDIEMESHTDVHHGDEA